MWETLTQPQATLLAGILTFAGALFGVILGWGLLSGRVKDLKTSIDNSDVLLKKHEATIEATLSVTRDQLEQLNVQVAATLGGLNQMRGAAAEPELPPAPANEPPGDEDSRRMLREHWASIRDHLEEIAADPRIDGRTRAKYGRIDRRSYLELIRSLDFDGALGDLTPRYREALELWQRFRSGRATPSAQDLGKMCELRRALVGDV